MYGKIIVPLDGSELAELALPYAEELSEKLGSDIMMLHVCEPLGSEDSHIHQLYIEFVSDATRGHLQGKTQVKSVVLSGKPPEAIIEYAEKNNVGLITMATRGHSGMKRWVLGSTADKVIRETSNPILLIRAKKVPPAGHEKGILSKMLVPLDGSVASEAILPYVEEIAAKLKAEIILLHVVASTHYVGTPEGGAEIPYSENEIEQVKAGARAYLEKAGSGLKSKGISIKSEVAVGKAAKEIVEFADKSNADLVAMSTH